MRTLVVTFVLVLCATANLMAYPALKLPVADDQVLKCDQHYNECAPTHCPNVTYNLAWDFNLYGFGGDDDKGYPVVAAADGRVVYAKNYLPGVDGWGNCVVVDYANDPSDHKGLYAHLDQIFVKVGEYVNSGQVVGTIGKGDGTYDAHLHYQVQSGTTPDGQSVSAEFVDAGVPTFPNTYTSQNSRTIDLEQSAQGSAIGNKSGTLLWWYGWNAGDRYDGSNCARRCYKQAYSGGSYGSCAIVYDGLGGARKAYTVRTGFWNNGQGNGWSQLNPAGPQSSLGMPITNEYANGSGARQDFQKGYLYYNGSSVSVNSYPNCAPGWTSSGWNNQYSYLFARAYERNGARNTLGEASGNVSGWNGFQRQSFNNGGCIMYDPNNAVGNAAATNEAYYLTGNFYTVFFQDYPNAWKTIGPPTRDREGNTQYFKKGRMVESGGSITVYNQHNRVLWTSGYHAAAAPDPKADITVLYNYGANPCQTRAHEFLSTGSGFTYQGDNGWAILNDYCLPLVVRSLSGDFDGDGLSDVAMLYQYDQCSVGIHMLLSTGAGFSYEPYWWQTDGYCPYAIKGSAAGDFNGDGKDDIAVVYDYGNCETRIHVLLSNGNGFDYQGNGGWWSASGYCAYAVKFVNAGDLNADGKDDLVLAYRYGSASTWLHAFLSNGSAFAYQGAWFNADGWFSLDAMKFMESGDINGDGKVDVVMACRYGPNETALLTFLSSGSGFNYQGWWWHVDYYSLDAVKYMQVGDITGDGKADVAMSYRYGEYSSAIHSFTSNGSAFAYAPYWWQGEGYGWDYTTTFAIGKFDGSGGTPKVLAEETENTLPLTFQLNQNYPNPFNPGTTIAYTLPSATHVTLDVFNILGQRVATLVNEDQAVGAHVATWDASRHASGVYLYRITTGAATETRKMLLLK